MCIYIYIYTHIHTHTHTHTHTYTHTCNCNKEERSGKLLLKAEVGERTWLWHFWLSTSALQSELNLCYHPLLCPSFLLSFSCLIPLVSFFLTHRNVVLIEMLCVCVCLWIIPHPMSYSLWLRRNPMSPRLTSRVVALKHWENIYVLFSFNFLQ